MIEARIYRRQFSSKRFRSFIINYKDSDLWIGVDAESFRPEMENLALEATKKFRFLLENYLLTAPEFGRTLKPYKVEPNAPEFVNKLSEAGEKAGVGPMAAVAGAFSEEIGKILLQKFEIQELVVENGGDIFMQLKKPLLLSIFAGESELSEKVGIEIPAHETPIGVCTSAGTVGPSISFGKADAVMVACKNTALADAFATGLANQIKTPDDVQTLAEKSIEYPDILSFVAICRDKLGIRSNFELKFIR